MNLKDLLNNNISQDDYLSYRNSTLLFKKMPIEINGLIIRKNDINVIIINDYLSNSNKKKVLLHEMAHLELDHTYKYNILSNQSDIYENEVSNYINNLNFD